MNSKELLQAQLSNSKRKPKGAKPDVSAGVTYNAELQRIVRAINADVNGSIVESLRALYPEYQADNLAVMDSWVDVLSHVLKTVREKWSSERFNKLADDIARKFVVTSSQSNLKRTERSFGINLYGDSRQLEDYIKLSIADNVRLIKSIPEQFLTQVDSIVMANVRAGNRPSAIVEQLSAKFDITKKRAKMIARSQTAMLTGQLNSKRQQSAGFDYFEWVDSSDERVRDRHAYLSNRVTDYGKGIYRWDDLPLSDKEDPIMPGQDYQCRCIARPVSQEEVDQNIKSGRVVKGVKR